MSSETAISVNNISKWFDLGLTGRTTSLPRILAHRLRHPVRGRGEKRERFEALHDITFDVERGEAVGVIGRNGAGKSTLLKILSRITPPSAGHIDISGHVGSLLEVGTGFHPELTGIENVYLNGTVLGMSKRQIEARLDEIVDFAGVDRFLDTPVKRYSSGMRVRLAFAVAAHLDPEIMIVDEVLSVGDAAFQAKCLEKMRSVANEEGRTVLYVSHNLVTVETLCPRALLLVDGELVFDGPTKETLARYMSTIPRAERGRSPGVFDLAAADRSRHQGITDLFQRLVLRPDGGPVGDTVRMGGGVQVEITVEGLDSMPHAGIGIVVGSPTVQKLFRMNYRMQALEASQPRCSRERIVVDIPSLPLIPGEYHMDVSAYDITDNSLIDQVHHAAEFSVIGADLLGNGYRYSSTDGEFVVGWDWEVLPATSEPPPVEEAVLSPLGVDGSSR